MILDIHLAGETLQLADDVRCRKAHAQDRYRGTADVVSHERVRDVPRRCACVKCWQSRRRKSQCLVRQMVVSNSWSVSVTMRKSPWQIGIMGVFKSDDRRLRNPLYVVSPPPSAHFASLCRVSLDFACSTFELNTTLPPVSIRPASNDGAVPFSSTVS